MSDPVQVREAETYVIGAAVSGHPDIDALAALVSPGDFYSPQNETFWQAIIDTHRSGAPVDCVSVKQTLDSQGIRFDPLALFSFAQAIPVLASADYHATLVAQAAGLRRIREAGMQIQGLGDKAGDLEVIREEVRSIADAATVGHGKRKSRTIGDALPDVIDTAQHGQTAVLGTGWPDVDRLIGGLAPGRLVIVGARPGVGKSVMGTNLALHFAQRHAHAVLIASLEMPEREVGQRLLAAMASANLTRLQNGSTDERTWLQIERVAGELGALPITIDDASEQGLTHIRAAARTIKRERDDLALIVVDYLQLMKTTPGINRAEALGEISRGLKVMAREMDACVVAMAQVNRESTKSADGRPRMSDLRESGSIEADADQVILLHQPDDSQPEIEVIVDKNRHGAKGFATLRIQGHYAQLVSVGGH